MHVFSADIGTGMIIFQSPHICCTTLRLFVNLHILIIILLHACRLLLRLVANFSIHKQVVSMAVYLTEVQSIKYCYKGSFSEGFNNKFVSNRWNSSESVGACFND